VIIFPAVDIKDGKCVRLAQGKADQVTVFSDDPVAMAKQWADQGASWLHVVDLDGAFEGGPVNAGLIHKICDETGLIVQLGGGIRDKNTAKAYLDAGVNRLIIGTLALEEEKKFTEIARAFPDRVGVSLDAENGVLKTKGWVKDSGVQIVEILPKLQSMGAAFIIYTDISRDGMRTGIHVDNIKDLCYKTQLPIIAAGGVHTIEDIKALFPLHIHGLEGVITGRALYEGTLDLKQALDWIADQWSI